MTATLAFVAAGGEMYLDSDRQLAYTQQINPPTRDVFQSPSCRQTSTNSSPARRAGSKTRGASGHRPSTAPAGGKSYRSRGAPAFRPAKQTKPKRRARPVEDRPAWDADTSPARPSGQRSRSRGRDQQDLSHLRPNIDRELFNRDRQVPRKAWDESVRVPPDKGSPMRKPFHARPAPQQKHRFKGSPSKRKPLSGFAKASPARRASGPTGPSRKPKAEFMGVSTYEIHHPATTENDEIGGSGRVLRIPSASAAVYSARDMDDSTSEVSRSPTVALQDIVARALTSAQDYNVDATASTVPTGTPSTMPTTPFSGSPDEVLELSSRRSESSPWGTLKLRAPTTTMETPVSIVTAEEVQNSVNSMSTSKSQASSAAATEVAEETNQQRFVVPEPEPEPEPELKPEPEPVAQTVLVSKPDSEPQPEPQPALDSQHEQGLPHSRPLFSQPLRRHAAEHLPITTGTNKASGASCAIAQGLAENSQDQDAGLTPEQAAAEAAAVAQQEAAEKAARERILEEEKEARRRADEYATRVLPARAKYEAALQHLRESETATQERWAVRRHQDTDRLATQRKAVLAAAELRRKRAQENGQAVLALVDRMRPKVVAYKEQYAAWYRRTYGSATARQPSRMRRMFARQQAALRLDPTDSTEVLANHLLDVVLDEVAEELDTIVGGTVDRVVHGELKSV